VATREVGCSSIEHPKYAPLNDRDSAAQRIVLKLRAAGPRRKGSGRQSVPATFKRMLGGVLMGCTCMERALVRRVTATKKPLGGHGAPREVGSTYVPGNRGVPGPPPALGAAPLPHLEV